MMAKQASGSPMPRADLYRRMYPVYLRLVPRYEPSLFELQPSSHAQTTRRSRSSHQSTTTVRNEVGVWKSPARHMKVAQDGLGRVSDLLRYHPLDG